MLRLSFSFSFRFASFSFCFVSFFSLQGQLNKMQMKVGWRHCLHQSSLGPLRCTNIYAWWCWDLLDGPNHSEPKLKLKLKWKENEIKKPGPKRSEKMGKRSENNLRTFRKRFETVGRWFKTVQKWSENCLKTWEPSIFEELCFFFDAMNRFSTKIDPKLCFSALSNPW